jgi:hypothetical protein
MSHRDDIYAELDALSITETGCKIWRKLHKSGDYPAEVINGKNSRLNRVVLERKLGRLILPGMWALHTCDVKMCVSEDHIYEGTPQRNAQDMVERGQHVSGWPSQVGADHSQARITEIHVLTIRRLVSLGFTDQHIGTVFGLSRRHVSSIQRGDRWRHVTNRDVLESRRLS